MNEPPLSTIHPGEIHQTTPTTTNEKENGKPANHVPHHVPPEYHVQHRHHVGTVPSSRAERRKTVRTKQQNPTYPHHATTNHVGTTACLVQTLQGLHAPNPKGKGNIPTPKKPTKEKSTKCSTKSMEKRNKKEWRKRNSGRKSKNPYV